MDKRYQVFVSSTFTDLEKERQEVMQALLELECIPSGMELFPAANEDQWSLIKKVIDDADYYVVVVGGRYGSLGPEGLSYTEMEYRYAMQIGKPIIGFVHRSPGRLSLEKSEVTEEGRAKLESFRSLVTSKPCRFWEDAKDLGSQVSRSLIKLIKAEPAIGWVRADLVPDESASQEILKLRRRIDELESEIAATRTSEPDGAAALAKGNDYFELGYSFVASTSGWEHEGQTYSATAYIEWDEIFFTISPFMIDEASDLTIAEALVRLVRDHAKIDFKDDVDLQNMRLVAFKLSQDDFNTIKVQLRALGLIRQSIKRKGVKDTATYWSLTPYGDTYMTQLHAIKKKDSEAVNPKP